jgi:hypothetical protein
MMFTIPAFLIAIAASIGYAPLRHAVFGRGLTRRRVAAVLEWVAPCVILYFLALLCGFLIGHPLTGISREVAVAAHWLTAIELGRSSGPLFASVLFYNALALYVGLAGVAGVACLIGARLIRPRAPEHAAQFGALQRVQQLETADKM